MQKSPAVTQTPHRAADRETDTSIAFADIHESRNQKASQALRPRMLTCRAPPVRWPRRCVATPSSSMHQYTRECRPCQAFPGIFCNFTAVPFAATKGFSLFQICPLLRLLPTLDKMRQKQYHNVGASRTLKGDHNRYGRRSALPSRRALFALGKEGGADGYINGSHLIAFFNR